jgi:hypothetical protein
VAWRGGANRVRKGVRGGGGGEKRSAHGGGGGRGGAQSCDKRSARGGGVVGGQIWQYRNVLGPKSGSFAIGLVKRGAHDALVSILTCD